MLFSLRHFSGARDRKLDTIVGPKGFSIFDGYGVQIEGNENRAMMTMMNYNFLYYRKLFEKAGFEKEVDFVSCYLTREQFVLPAKMQEVARRVEERGYFKVKTFETKKELRDWSWRIGQTYNKTFVNNWEYYPLTEREIQFLLDSLLTIADPKMIKVIMHNEDIIGFLFGFPDVSEVAAATKRQSWLIATLGNYRYSQRIQEDDIHFVEWSWSASGIPGSRGERAAL